MLHWVPCQCWIRGSQTVCWSIASSLKVRVMLPVFPTAHASVAVKAMTLTRPLAVKTAFGLATICQPLFPPVAIDRNLLSQAYSKCQCMLSCLKCFLPILPPLCHVYLEAFRPTLNPARHWVVPYPCT